jgi:hypothetical protein
MLLIVDSPVELLPIISIQMLLAAIYTTGWQLHQIDWQYLLKSLKILFIPKVIGVMGLILISPNIMALIIYSIILVYAIIYIRGEPAATTQSKTSKAWDALLLILGGYASGVSLVGAPLIVPIFTKNVAKEQLRNTLFVLWFILVFIKLSAFIITDTDLQLIHQFWLLPAAMIGHFIGMQFHHLLQQQDDIQFKRYIGIGLLIVTLIGLSKYL